MRPSSINQEFWSQNCDKQFLYSGGIDDPYMNVTTTELNYKGRNIIYTYGIEDPWQWAGVRASYD